MVFDGFVGPSYVARLLQTSAEECINLFPETLESPNANPPRILRKVPGLATVITSMAGAVRGQFAQDGRAFCVAGNSVYETTTGAAVLLGTVITDGLPAQMETNGSQLAAGGHQILLRSAGFLYVLDLNQATPSVTPVSAVFLQGTVISIAYTDGVFLAATKYQVFQSALEDGSSWNAASVGAREIATDDLAGIIANYPQHTLWLFGTKRTEVWYDTSGAVFSFGPIPGVLVNVGLAASASVCRFNNTLGWLGQDENGTRIVYQAAQFLPQRISTTAVEYDLAQCASVSDFVGYAYQEEGHTFYVLTSQANQRTWVYDAKEQLWHKRATWNRPTGAFQASRGATHIVSPSGTHWIGDATTGTIYRQSLDLYDDAGSTLRWLRRFPHIQQQQHRVFYPGFVLDAQKGIGLSTGQGSNPQVMLRWSNDGGETWSNEHWRSLGVQGAFNARTYWQRLGMGRNRVWELSGSDAIPLALTGVYFDPDPTVGSN